MKLGFLMLTAAAVCLAQAGPAGPPPLTPRVDQLKAYLNLTDSQIQSLQQLMQQHRDAVRPIHDEMAAKQTSLRQQLQQGSTDAAALGRILLDIESLRRRLDTARTSLQTQAQNVLTEAQRTRLKALEDAAALREEIQGAAMLHLITPPQPAEGGFGPLGAAPGGPFGPRGAARMRR
jgi:Spy/CpxP family protein refolding chaperone